METNAYATQSETSVWYEVQERVNGRWRAVADTDTEAEAHGLMEEYALIDDEADTMRVRKMRGQA